MTNEIFVYNKGKKTAQFTYDKGKKSSDFAVNYSKKPASYNVSKNLSKMLLIYPYGDFNNDTDITNFWATSLDSVDVYESLSGEGWDTDHVFTVSIEDGALKIDTDYTGTGSYRYSKAIPVTVGNKYKIAGTTVDTEYDLVSIYGGSTLGAYDYFGITGSGSGSDNDWEDHLHSEYGNGTSTFTATTSTFYLRFNFSIWGGWVKFDDLSLINLDVVKTPPSWNQTVDDTSQDFYRTWDWVFMSKGFDAITENWEDFG